MTRPYSLLAIAMATAVSLSAACAGVKTPIAHAGPPPPGASMWVEPNDLSSRDLFNGPWGRELAPDPKATYKLVEYKHTGINLGMTVEDQEGREWSVKQPFPGGLDSEAPVEVALSRILSAVGYHQPPIYYLSAFKLKDDWGTHVETGGRFRLKEESLKFLGPWRWEDNPFVGTKPYQGLIVLLTMFNSTDLKNDNNSIYEKRDGDLVQHWYVARDIGAALGDMHPLAPRKGDPASFERLAFTKGVTANGNVEFANGGWYKALVRDRITPAEVAWACELLGQLSDEQWSDAFRAGGYEPAVANRFIAKLKEKVAEGRSLNVRAAARE